MEWTENLIRLADFASERNVDRNALTQYVRYHPEIFSGHITEYKRSLYGDDFAIHELDKKYPLPKPVEIIKDPEADDLRRQVIDLQDQLLARQKQIIALTEKAAQVESIQALLENREQQIANQTSHVEYLEKELDVTKNDLMVTSFEKQKVDILLAQANKQLSEEVDKRLDAEQKLEDIRHMGWLQRLFWRY